MGSAKVATRKESDNREPDGQPESCGPVQSSLSGHGKLLMFVNVAPGMADAGETLCSLQFAARVRGVELGPAKRHVEAGSEIGELRAKLARLKAQVGSSYLPAGHSSHKRGRIASRMREDCWKGTSKPVTVGGVAACRWLRRSRSDCRSGHS